MSGGYFSYALLAALATALLTAAVTDLRRREISNWLNLSIALTAPVWWLALNLGPIDLGVQLALAAGTFVFACLLFATGQMGGGDVKLLGALALWFTPSSFWDVIVLMALLGGAMSIAMAAFNIEPVSGESMKDKLALGAAMLWICGVGALVFTLATGRSLISSKSLSAALDFMPGPWAIVLCGLASVFLLVVGFRHIMHRQKSRVEVPYGVAIAASALWVMGSQILPLIHSDS